MNNSLTDTASADRRLTVALVDGFTGGHHLTHLRHYGKTLLEMGHEVWAFLPDPDCLTSWLLRESPALANEVRCNRYVHAAQASPFWRLRKLYVPIHTWRHAARAIDAMCRRAGRRPDLVFFNWLDDYILGDMARIARVHRWVFPYRWSGVYFHPWHLRAPDGEADPRYARAEALLKHPRCPGVGVLDAGVRANLAQRLQKPVIAFPDETEESLPPIPSPLVRRLHQAARGRKIIALVGELSRRKGIVNFLRVAEHVPDWFFLMAGEYGAAQRATLFDDERAFVDRALHAQRENLLVLGERIEDEREFNALVWASDVLFAAYTTFGHSSGIVTKAAVFRKPVLVSPGYCMEEVVTRYRMGVAVNPDDLSRVIEALRLLVDPIRFLHEIGRPEFDACHRRHTPAALRDAFKRFLEHVPS